MTLLEVGAVVAGHVVTLTLACDHRLIGPADAAAFLRALSL